MSKIFIHLLILSLIFNVSFQASVLSHPKIIFRNIFNDKEIEQKDNLTKANIILQKTNENTLALTKTSTNFLSNDTTRNDTTSNNTTSKDYDYFGSLSLIIQFPYFK